MDIDWSSAPEGTTHARTSGDSVSLWYKVEDELLYYFSRTYEHWSPSWHNSIEELASFTAGTNTGTIVPRPAKSITDLDFAALRGKVAFKFKDAATANLVRKAMAAAGENVYLVRDWNEENTGRMLLVCNRFTQEWYGTSRTVTGKRVVEL